MKQRNNLGYYDRWATEWWSQSAKVYALNYLNEPRFEYFDRHIANWQGLNVLDVGCGGGFTCEFLAKRGAMVTGVDQSIACIHAAKDHAVEHELAIAYHPAHSECLPFADETFDVVTCVDVLEHVENLHQTLQEIHRVLKPGGTFCFDTVNRTMKSKLIMIWLLEDLLKEIPPGIHDWRKFIQPQELTHRLRSLNFQAIDLIGFNLFGSTLIEHIQAYRDYRRTRKFDVRLNADTSIMYIGKAEKKSVSV
ncbi:MAG: bifunctional 2-polyprenyl-6-hydroxyphenol methylase/3-demethylubiquinol 3-O-methyltransferase UbiG [Leptolyngbyaceae cyanobacterium bins.349]|nr:bifunctional 2-polyprenyl-6-hydroxyphenol methylase/3-demethylubiquinol 3-O-methyltransferase UbiG [Leptolyngbyaceae cyanobacterium bins.349]